MVKFFRWIAGRQHDKCYPFYFKMKLLCGKKWGCYLIRCNVGCFIGYHLDPVKEGYKHYRLNIHLIGNHDPFHINPLDGNPIFKWWRFILFRPDIQHHGLGLLKRKRLILSIGWIKKG